MKLYLRYALILGTLCLLILILLPASKKIDWMSRTVNQYQCHRYKTVHTDLHTKNLPSLGDRDNIMMPFMNLNGESRESYSERIMKEQVAKFKSQGRKLKVILVPHSHNDPGWLLTLSGYFKESTVNILNNMLIKLWEHPNMTFVWAESVFLQLWWEELNAEQRALLKSHLKSGRLEIVNGGWVVPDEATTNIFSLVDQLIEGHQFLNQTLGVFPENTWSIDPFGYSDTMPYLVKKAGMKHMVMDRASKHTKNRLQEISALEYYWTQSWDIHGKYNVLAHIMPYGLYGVGDTCGPFHDICLRYDFSQAADIRSDASGEPTTARNIHARSLELLQQYYLKSRLFRHNVIMVPLGNDFKYNRSEEWDHNYGNYSKLFTYMNTRTEWNVEAKFGTVRDYFSEVEKATEETDFPSMSGDFFPYTDNGYDYWTGYFTTRPYMKLLGSEVENALRTADILYSFASLSKNKIRGDEKSLEYAHRALGLFQHHDAITGTSRAFVAEDYRKKLRNALFLSLDVTANSIASLLDLGPDATRYSNIHQLRPEAARKVRLLSDQPFLFKQAGSNDTPSPRILKIKESPAELHRIVIVNTQGHVVTQLVRVYVDSSTAQVIDELEPRVIIPCQVNLVFHPSNLSIARDYYELVILVTLKPMSTRGFKVSHALKPPQCHASTVTLYGSPTSGLNSKDKDIKVVPSDRTDRPIQLENKDMKLSFTNGLLNEVRTDESSLEVNIKFFQIRSPRGGAYVFKAGFFDPIQKTLESRTGVKVAPTRKKSWRRRKPRPTIPPPTFDLTAGNQSRHIIVIRGKLVSEVRLHQELERMLEHENHTNALHHVTRLNHVGRSLGRAVELENHINLEPSNFDTFSREIGMNLTTSIKSDRTFYTDLNGLSMARRTYDANQGIETNMYPMTTMAYIEDCQRRLSLLTRHTHGVSSVQTGSLQILLERKTALDDGKGLGESINDPDQASSLFYLLIEKRTSAMHDSTCSPNAALVKDDVNVTSTGYNVSDNTDTISLPTITSSAMSTALKFPATVLLLMNYQKEAKYLNINFGLSSSSLCHDLKIMNIRPRLSDQGLGVILHKSSFDCDFPSMMEACPINRAMNRMLFENIFNGLKIAKVRKYTLSFMYDLGGVSGEEVQDDSPEEIESFLVSFAP